MTAFIRFLMESALKTNDVLKLAVITGCLRASKESIFTGLNMISVMSDRFAEYFRFTEAEVSELLKYYVLENRVKELKEWYGGYLFGQTKVYDLWNLLFLTGYLKAVRTSFDGSRAYMEIYRNLKHFLKSG